MARTLSGIRASGTLHLGNYLGALLPWLSVQDTNAFFFIADLHSLTEARAGHDPAAYARMRRATAAGFLAAGLTPEASTLFFQSDVKEHTELLWLMSVVARKGELERMTQWKDKAGQRSAGASASLFFYPVLMAADILLYDAERVPVGDDQRQHVEATRDWASRFNNYFGAVFSLPVASVPTEGARVMDLQVPTDKMSKTSSSANGVIYLTDDADTIMRKVRRSTTDALNAIHYDPVVQPGISNLLTIYAALTGRAAIEVASDHMGTSYGVFKEELGQLLVDRLVPIGRAARELESDPAELERVLSPCTDRARTIASATCRRARNAIGLP